MQPAAILGRSRTNYFVGKSMKRLLFGNFSAAAAIALLFAIPAYAGQQKPGAIPGPKADVNPAAKAQFKCEVRPFDQSQGLFCYGPAAIRAAYGIDKLVNNHLTGKGQTIVIIDAFGSPFALQDLQLFDAAYGLNDPEFIQDTSLNPPPFDPTNADMVGWTGEIALDTQWSHAIAPDAKIVLIAAKSDFDNDLTDALNYALKTYNPTVVSMSFGESETALSNPDGLDAVKAWTSAFRQARRQHVTLFVSSGDNGVDALGIGLPSVQWPSSSPLVTGVGGTNLLFGTATNAAPPPGGSYQSEMVWNDGFGAGGGGMSILMAEPDFQSDNVPHSVNKTLHGYRGVPDVAYNAGVVGGVVVAWSEPFGPGAFFIFGGTSAGAPQWAGIAADLSQAQGKPLGFINKQLYRLGGSGLLRFLSHDVTTGDNGIDGVPGYPATRGYDLSTGWGTPNFGGQGVLLCDPNDDWNEGP
jgi:subtilase family serine protease